MKIERAHDALQVLVAFAAKEFDFEPVWTRMSIGRRRQWRRGVGDNVEGGAHSVNEKPLF